MDFRTRSKDLEWTMWLESWRFQFQPPSLWGGKRVWILNRWQAGNDLVSCTYVMLLLLLSRFSCVRLWPQRRQPTRLPRPWDFPGKNTGVGCHFLLQCMKVKTESEVPQSCPTRRDPMDCSLSGSSVHGIFQARVLEWDLCNEASIKTPNEGVQIALGLLNPWSFGRLMCWSFKKHHKHHL